MQTRNDGDGNYRRTTQISTSPTTAETMPTIRRMLSGVASALFIARRIQAGLAANIRPSSTKQETDADEEVGERYGPHRMTISRHSGASCFYPGEANPNRAITHWRPPVTRISSLTRHFAAAAAGGWPDGLPKKRKNSESGRSRKRVSLHFSPVS